MFNRLGQAMEFSPVGSGNRACRGRSAGDNSAERLDSMIQEVFH